MGSLSTAHHKGSCLSVPLDTSTVTKPGGMKENRREWRGRDGWLVCFHRSTIRRFSELYTFFDLRALGALEGKIIRMQLDGILWDQKRTETIVYWPEQLPMHKRAYMTRNTEHNSESVGEYKYVDLEIWPATLFNRRWPKQRRQRRQWNLQQQRLRCTRRGIISRPNMVTVI